MLQIHFHNWTSLKVCHHTYWNEKMLNWATRAKHHFAQLLWGNDIFLGFLSLKSVELIEISSNSDMYKWSYKFILIMDKLSRLANHQNILLLPSMLHINTRCLLLIFASHLIHISLYHIGLVHIFWLLSLHMCKGRLSFLASMLTIFDWNFRRQKFRETEVSGG